MGTPQHFPVQETRQSNIRSVAGAARDFIHPVVPNGTGANHLELMLVLRFHIRLPYTKMGKSIDHPSPFNPLLGGTQGGKRLTRLQWLEQNGLRLRLEPIGSSLPSQSLR